MAASLTLNLNREEEQNPKHTDLEEECALTNEALFAATLQLREELEEIREFNAIERDVWNENNNLVLYSAHTVHSLIFNSKYIELLIDFNQFW